MLSTSEQDFQTVRCLNANYPDGFFKLIDLLASVDDVGGNNVGHHEHVVEEEEVLWLNFPTCHFFHPKHPLREKASIALNKALVARAESVLYHLHSVARLLLLVGHRSITRFWSHVLIEHCVHWKVELAHIVQVDILGLGQEEEGGDEGEQQGDGEGEEGHVQPNRLLHHWEQAEHHEGED